MGTYWSLVEQAATEFPDAVLLADDYGRTLTAPQLRDEAARVAAGLWEGGLRPGDVLSWQLPSILEVPVLMAACARLGLVQNPIIPLLRHREVGYILDQVGATVAVVPATWRGFGHEEMVREVSGCDVLPVDLGAPPASAIRLPVADPGGLPAPPGDGTAGRWIYYSSGTTADPKGARHSDEALIAAGTGVIEGLGLRRGEVYPIAWPFAHIGGVSMLSASLRAGGQLVLFDAFDPVETPLRMAARHATILGSATPFFVAYMAAQREHGTEPLFPQLRACVAGGAPTPAAVNDEVAETLGVSGVVGAWGLTEFPVATSESSADDDIGYTAGRPADGVKVRVVDGELQLRGPQCFLGYVDPALDAAAFDDGWFRTGDLGSIDERGRVRIDGRLKDVIIRNAENISAREVEEALLRHPSVSDVAVIGVPDPRTGERVCAIVVCGEGTEPALSDLVAHCREIGLASYKWPERIATISQLPRNSMGKILKRDLAAYVAELPADQG